MKRLLFVLATAPMWGQQASPLAPTADPIVMTIGTEKITRSMFEQFIATDHLRVGSISDLHQGRISSFHVVTTVPVLGNDAFQIPLADQFKQSFAVSFDVIDKNQMIRIARN